MGSSIRGWIVFLSCRGRIGGFAVDASDLRNPVGLTAEFVALRPDGKPPPKEVEDEKKEKL